MVLKLNNESLETNDENERPIILGIHEVNVSVLPEVANSSATFGRFLTTELSETSCRCWMAKLRFICSSA